MEADKKGMNNTRQEVEGIQFLTQLGASSSDIAALAKSGITIDRAILSFQEWCKSGQCADVHDDKSLFLDYKKQHPEHFCGIMLQQLGFYSVPDLTPEERKPPEFIVDGLLPVGMTVLSGKPKTRKSFMALQLGISVATGKPFLGRSVLQSDVAYFDLEGSKSRISTRLESMTDSIPYNLFITNRLDEKLSGDFLRHLRLLHRQNPNMRLFIIDTYSRARGKPKGTKGNAYDADVAFLEPVQRMAIEENFSILFVHHDRKGADFSSDSLERLSGTMGISGSADCVLNLITEGKRFENSAVLEYTPRDAKSGKVDLHFDEDTSTWAFAKSQNPLEEAVCQWVIDNCPKKGVEGKFYGYDEIFRAVWGTEVSNAGERVTEVLKPRLAELYSAKGIGIQLPVKSNGKRGLRIYQS